MAGYQNVISQVEGCLELLVLFTSSFIAISSLQNPSRPTICPVIFRAR